MKSLAEIYQKNGSLHHAYLITGRREDIVADLSAFLENDFGIALHGNPDFWCADHDSFGIDEGRAVKEAQENRAFGTDGRKVFVIAANSMTREAQNSLLKVFEEPTPSTHFFLIMPSAETLLPTLRSRLIHIEAESAGDAPAKKLAKEFLAAGKAARLALAKELAEEVSDEDKTRADIMSFTHELERLVREKSGKNAPDRGHSALLSEILSAKDYLADRSASVKMLIEHLALILPVL